MFFVVVCLDIQANLIPLHKLISYLPRAFVQLDLNKTVNADQTPQNVDSATSCYVIDIV